MNKFIFQLETDACESSWWFQESACMRIGTNKKNMWICLQILFTYFAPFKRRFYVCVCLAKNKELTIRPIARPRSQIKTAKKMSFVQPKEVIEDGDVIMIWAGFKTNIMVTVRKGKTSQIKYGCIRHDDLIGSKFGSKHQCAKGNFFVMAPTPELWSLNLPHRTQILYATDISMITSLLYLQPGFKVM